MRFRHLAASLAIALPLLAGCRSDESLNPPAADVTDGLLARYVSMGNSITAGFQSAGINQQTQAESYAALFAAQAGAPFYIPSFNMPGCPAPFVNNVTQERLGNLPPSQPCALRASASADVPYVSNVAVPSAHVIDLLTNLDPASNANTLTTLILGGRTQVQAMMRARPTFVSIWIGNNDVLGAFTSSANPGNPALITSQAAFEAAYGEVLDSVDATGAQGALIGVADVTVTPFASLGVIYYCLKNGGSGLGLAICTAAGIPAEPMIAGNPQITVAASCAPVAAGGVGDQTLIPWTKGVVRILEATQPGQTRTIDCAIDEDVVTAAEIGQLQAATAAFNGYIEDQAEARGWVYLDVNTDLRALQEDDAIPPFPDITGVATGGPVTFGPYFSLDGVHPTAAAHRLVAARLIEAVNATYETEIPALSLTD